MPDPEVSFVMPAYRAADTLPAALEHVLAQRTERPFEVIVVDDGSPDDSADVARTFATRDARVEVLTKANGGEASALNVGWRAARGRFVAIVEADVEAEPEWLERCLAVLDTEPDAWAAGGYLVTPPDDPWVARLAGYEVERKFATKPRDAKHLTSANVVYRREAFDVAGPFDERLLNASLDSVFNARLCASGKRLVYVADARVRHHYKTTALGYLRRQYAYARYRVHNTVLDLYPADRFLAVHVALAGLAVVGLAALPLAPLVPPEARPAVWACGPGLLALAVLLQVPRALGLCIERRDPAALVYPPLIVVRNVVGAFGYGIGLIMKTLGRV